MKKLLCEILLVSAAGIFCSLCVNLGAVKTAEGCVADTIEYVGYINAKGEFESPEKTNVVLSYPVCVNEVFVKEGEYVNKGQALFSLDKDKMVSLLSEYRQYAEKDLKANEVYMLPRTVFSPQAGVLRDLAVYPGAVAMSGRVLASVVSSGEIMAKFTLTQPEYGRIKVGYPVIIKSAAFRDASYDGVITDKSAVVKRQVSSDGTSVVIDVFASINAPDDRVCDGLQIDGKIQSGEPRKITAVDYRFINRDEKGEFVYILKNGKAEKRYVRTGVEDGDMTELVTSFPGETVFLRGDIEEGDRVITHPAQ